MKSYKIPNKKVLKSLSTLHRMSEWRIVYFFSCEGHFKRFRYLQIFACEISVLRTKRTVHSKKQTSLQSLDAFHVFWHSLFLPTTPKPAAEKHISISSFEFTLCCVGHLFSDLGFLAVSRSKQWPFNSHREALAQKAAP